MLMLACRHRGSFGGVACWSLSEEAPALEFRLLGTSRAAGVQAAQSLTSLPHRQPRCTSQSHPHPGENMFRPRVFHTLE